MGLAPGLGFFAIWLAPGPLGSTCPIMDEDQNWREQERQAWWSSEPPSLTLM